MPKPSTRIIFTPPPEPAPPPVSHFAVPFAARIYVSVQGDWWDTIAMRVYGFKRGNEHLMYRLIEANYPLRDISLFPAGVGVIVPDAQIETEIPLVPWKIATLTP
jgi:phage tail protein X